MPLRAWFFVPALLCAACSSAVDREPDALIALPGLVPVTGTWDSNYTELWFASTPSGPCVGYGPGPVFCQTASGEWPRIPDGSARPGMIPGRAETTWVTLPAGYREVGGHVEGALATDVGGGLAIATGARCIRGFPHCEEAREKTFFFDRSDGEPVLRFAWDDHGAELGGRVLALHESASLFVLARPRQSLRELVLARFDDEP